tara:strand:- start:1584 stop:1895 length:312 start_codon:yes stop_codon:yes gene_type:complete
LVIRERRAVIYLSNFNARKKNINRDFFLKKVSVNPSDPAKPYRTRLCSGAEKVKSKKEDMTKNIRALNEVFVFLLKSNEDSLPAAPINFHNKNCQTRALKIVD